MSSLDKKVMSLQTDNIKIIVTIRIVLVTLVGVLTQDIFLPTFSFQINSFYIATDIDRTAVSS